MYFHREVVGKYHGESRLNFHIGQLANFLIIESKKQHSDIRDLLAPAVVCGSLVFGSADCIMHKYVMTGFDSAWSANNKGAIISMVVDGTDKRIEGPLVVSFDDAYKHIVDIGSGIENHLVAIDQPLVVSNAQGSRPVERLVGSVMGTVGSATQRASLGKSKLWGNDAPLWDFLLKLNGMNFSHVDIQQKTTGFNGRRYLEVYPAFGNLGLFQEYVHRRRVPK